MVIFISQQSGISAAVLADKGFPAVAEIIAGKWLGGFIAFAGMAQRAGHLRGGIVIVCRVPKVMADDDLLPQGLNRQHSKFPNTVRIYHRMLVSGELYGAVAFCRPAHHRRNRVWSGIIA